MSFLRRFALRLYNFFRPGPAEAQLARETASHLALLEEGFQRKGMTREQAVLAAKRAWGSVDQVKERHRDTRSFVWLEDARRDVQYAVRTLARAPGFTTAAVLTLALGIGAVTVIYSVLHNVLLDPLPYRDSDRLVNLLVRDTQTRRFRMTFAAPEFLDYQDHSSVFEDVVGTAGESMMYATADRLEIVRAVWVTPNFFDFMGLGPLIGRAAGPDDGRPDAPPVAVLRHRLWVSQFASDPNVVGRTILLNGEPRTIIGVMPPRFTWHAADLWIPRPIDRTPDSRAPFRNFQARLKPGVTLPEADAQLNLIAARRAREHPAEYPANFRIEVVNVIAFTVGQFSRVLYITLAAVALLLLIACCNVANMLLARATTREREMTVRAALGAGRWRIVRQLMVESALLSAGGAAAGCLLAYVGIDALVSVLPQGPLPGEIDITLNGPVLVVSLGTAVVSALLFGIAPAIYSARRNLVDGLKSAGKGIAGGRSGLRNALVVAEIALSLLLLLGAGLLMRTFMSLTRVDLGFNPRNVTVVSVVFAPGQMATGAEKHAFFQQTLQRVASLPGIEAAAATTGIPPFSGGSNSELEVPGTPRSDPGMANVQLCTEDYFRTLGIPFVRGRGLPAATAGAAPRVAVVNETMARDYFPGEDPIGRPIRLTSEGRESDPARHGLFEIVGVVSDVRNQGIQNLPAPHVYLPGATAAPGVPVILVRTAAGAVNPFNAIRGEIALVDPRVALRQPSTLEEMLQRSFYSQPRFSLIVLGVFAVTGTLLVAMGVFSVMAYTVTRQTREIAVRMALGAGRGHVMGVVLRSGGQLLALGVAAGLLGNFATSRLIASQLWNTSRNDPVTLAAAVSVMTVVAFAACYIPARRAMGVDPMAALRQD
jgi:predicted permease